MDVLRIVPRSGLLQRLKHLLHRRRFCDDCGPCMQRLRRWWMKLNGVD